jgi:hypothetical protein
VTLHILPDLVQGSDEWLDQRRGMVTASVVGRLITNKTLQPSDNPDSRALTAFLVAERITGYTEPSYVSDDMLRGVSDEPVARELYSEHFAPVTEVGLMVRDDWGFKIGFSPDGLVGGDGIIEIKSRRQKKQLQTVLADEVPAENMAQMMCGLLVSGRKWCDYVSFSAGMHLWVKRVHPDPRWFEAIVSAVEQFERISGEMIDRYRSAVVGLPVTERAILQEMVI